MFEVAAVMTYVLLGCDSFVWYMDTSISGKRAVAMFIPSTRQVSYSHRYSFTSMDNTVVFFVTWIPLFRGNALSPCSYLSPGKSHTVLDVPSHAGIIQWC
jgi:hypothetical protein